ARIVQVRIRALLKCEEPGEGLVRVVLAARQRVVEAVAPAEGGYAPRPGAPLRREGNHLPRIRVDQVGREAVHVRLLGVLEAVVCTLPEALTVARTEQRARDARRRTNRRPLRVRVPLRGLRPAGHE